MLRSVLAGLLSIFLAVGPLLAETAVRTSTSTPRHYPLEKAGRELQKAIKKTNPNPRVRPPRPEPLPVQAPPMPPKPTPTPEEPKSGADRFFNAAAKIMTKSWGDNIFVWLPAISTDPNTGPTYGIMPVLVLADPRTRHIRHLIAPSYTHNGLFGQTVTGRYYFYPTDESQLYSVVSYSQYVNREIKMRYENTSAHDGVLYVKAEAAYNANASKRFFGIGPKTRNNDETGFTSKITGIRGAIGVNFANAWRVSTGARFQRFATAPNVIDNTVDIATRFPNVPGLGARNTVATEFRLLWDTRDSGVTPSKGSSGELFAEKTSQALDSDSDFFRWGLEGKRLFAWNDRHITALRGLYEQVNGPFIPFHELTTVGGRSTLRGYGDGRFADEGRFVTNIEHRFIFSQLALMGIQTNFELAPFFDLGTVFPAANQMQRKDFRPVFGTAFRAAVKPNVVGDVELGVGKEGVAVFVDINYPF